MSNEPTPIICEHSDNKPHTQDNVSHDKLNFTNQTEATKASNTLDERNVNIMSTNQDVMQGSQIEEKQDHLLINNLIFDFNKSSKLIDDELDKISFSSDEDTIPNENNKIAQKKNINNDGNLTKSEYEKESIRIRELYNNNEENDGSTDKYFGTKNELSELKEIPLIFVVEDNFTTQLAGNVINKSFEGKFVMKAEIINGILDLDNIVFNENKLPIGYVDDVLGKIDIPFYIIKFFPNYTGSNDLQGQKLFYVKEKAKFVNKFELVKLKGSDASNAYDEEIEDDEKEYSDDEIETSKKRKGINKNNNHNTNNTQPANQNNVKNTKNNYQNKNKNQDFYQGNTNFNNNLNNNSANLQNCQEYRIGNNNNNYSNYMYQNNYNNNNNNNNNNFNNFNQNQQQQQQFFQNMMNSNSMFNPNSMFSPYTNQNLNQNVNQINNPAFLQHVNPFLLNNNLNKK